MTLKTYFLATELLYCFDSRHHKYFFCNVDFGLNIKSFLPNTEYATTYNYNGNILPHILIEPI